MFFPGRPDTGGNAFVLTKHFLSYLRQRISSFVPVDTKDPDERVETIVGHPVQWNADQREATLRAAQEAGFPNVRLEEESLAALYCHVFDERTGFKPKPGSHVLTIDMGGGTTDFAFLQIPSKAEERPVSIPVHPTPEGGRSYGGRDLDLLLLSYLSRSWDQELVKSQGRALLREVRKFKEAFSDSISDGAFEYQSMLQVGENRRLVRLTRAEFEQVAAHYIQYLEVLVRGALEQASLRPEQVEQLILTGGHSRWYFVERTLGKIFPHLFVGRRTIFRHSHPEQSVARGLAYDPLVRSNKGGFLTPKRRAAHPVWLHIPGRAMADGNGALAAPPSTGDHDKPVLLLPRGQLLPFRTQRPLRFLVEQPAADSKATQVRIQFLSGQDRVPLAGRIATFHRGFWEQVGKSMAMVLPWSNSAKLDRFEVQVYFHVSENELISAELAVTRLVGGKPVEMQRQNLQMNIEAAMGRDTFGW